ncbi:MAG: class I SAM-dependent methyltransferase [Acidimicrobiia bacterium]
MGNNRTMGADDWDSRYSSTPLVWGSDPNQFFAATVESIAPGRSLDVGCGEGRNTIWLAQRGWDATGIDFSPVAIDKARQLATHSGVEATFAVADIEIWSPEPATFDLVAWVYVHLPEPVRTEAVKRVVTGLRTGGLLVWVGHDLDNITNGVGGPQDPAVLARVDELTAMLDGLEIVEAKQVLRNVATESGHGRSEPDKPSAAIDQLVIARVR